MATATATEAAATAGVVITLTGSIMGLQFDALMLGFVGALVAQTLVPEPPGESLPPLRRYVWTLAQLVAAGMLAGILTPIAESLVAGIAPGNVPAQALHLATAGIIGMVAPTVIPMLRKITSKIAEKP